MLIITNIHILKNGDNKVMDFKVFVNPPSAIFSTPPPPDCSLDTPMMNCETVRSLTVLWGSIP